MENESLYLHVCVPLVGPGVEETPAGCILRRHDAVVQSAQHGHHIVLNSTCSCEVLEELWPSHETMRSFLSDQF